MPDLGQVLETLLDQAQKLGLKVFSVEKALSFSTEMYLYLHGKQIDHMYVGLFLQLSIMFHYEIT